MKLPYGGSGRLRAAAFPKFEGQRKVPRLLVSKKLCFRPVQDASFTLFLWNVTGGDFLMILESPSPMSFPLITVTLSVCNLAVLWKAGFT